MGVVRHIGSKSEAEILAMTSADPKWYDLAFYFPNDDPYIPYYYRVIHGEMKKYGGDGSGSASGVGITLNDEALAGVKTFIEEDETLFIPENYDYNTFSVTVEGVVNCDGQINIL